MAKLQSEGLLKRSGELAVKFLPYALLLSVTFAMYGASLYFDFVWDDFHYVYQNFLIRGLSPTHLRSIWSQGYFGQYAPLHISFLAILYSFSGLEPFGYHLGQLLAHAACVCLLYFILKSIESSRVALLASLLFAVYPPNIEVVAWVSETKSSLALLFFLLSFWFFLRLRASEHWIDGAGCALFLVLSLLTKMSTVVAPAIFLLYDYKQGSVSDKGSKVWRNLSLAGFFLIAAVFSGIHLVSSHRAMSASPQYLIDSVLTDVQLSPSSLSSGYFGGAYVHFLNFPRFLLFYIRMLVFPYPLSGWHMVRVPGGLGWSTGAAWIALLGLIWLLNRSPRDLQFWELWFYIFLAPVLQIVPNATWVADRYLYIPAIGAFVLWSKLFFHLLDRLGEAWLRIGWEALTAAILLAFAWQTQHDLPVWQDDLAFWKATTKTCMTSAYCHNRLGQALLVNGYPRPALSEFYQAVQIRPAPLYLIYLADTYAGTFGDYRRALLAYQAAQQSGLPLPPDYWTAVAKTYYWAGDLEQASRAIESGREINPDEFGLLVVTGFVQWREGKLAEARKSLDRALLVTGQTANAAWLINQYWGNHAEASRLLSDLGFQQGGPATDLSAVPKVSNQ